MAEWIAKFVIADRFFEADDNDLYKYSYMLVRNNGTFFIGFRSKDKVPEHLKRSSSIRTLREKIDAQYVIDTYSPIREEVVRYGPYEDAINVQRTINMLKGLGQEYEVLDADKQVSIWTE